ncbi:hypothetical protein R3P38DRAFT_3263088 [Favolaschia claudopus]|uniref:Uncharacterized protein n=1 Tax=Favolaschia claudopus TaxID=2862362 RepID=A0AAW0CDZ2_9AGAR
MPCLGKSARGCSSSCVGFEPKKKGVKVDDDTKCKHCGHRKRVHRSNAVQDVMAQSSDRISQLKKSTGAEARKESYSGFRPKEVKSGGTSSKAAGPTKKRNEKKEKVIRIHSIQVMVGGLDGDGKLRVEQPYSTELVNDLRAKGLTAFETRDEGNLEFQLGWSHKEVDTWLREVLPLLFEYLDRCYPDDAAEFHWVLLGKSKHTLFAMDRKVTGELLDEVKGAAGRGYREQTIRIATKHRIPEAAWKSFDDALDAMTAGGDPIPSESESESELEPPPKRRARKSRSKSRSKVVAAQTSSADAESSEASAADGDSDVEDVQDESEDSNNDDKSVKVKKEIDDPLFLRDINADSDVEEVFPQRLLWDGGDVSGGEAPSRKRTASPALVSEQGSKRARSGSAASHHSTISISDDSPSPRLNAATSSFQFPPPRPPAAVVSGSLGTRSLRTGNSISAPTFGAAAGSASTSAIHPITTGSVPSASSASFFRPTRASTGATVRKYVPPPPRQGLKVPPSESIW